MHETVQTTTEHRLHGVLRVMEIRFISSLTPEDENRIAPALLSAVSSVLDRMPIAYTLRFETVSGRSFQHVHSPEATEEADTLFEHAEVPARRGR